MRALYSIVEGIFNAGLSDDQVFIYGQEFINNWANKSNHKEDYLDFISCKHGVFKIGEFKESGEFKIANPANITDFGVPIKKTIIDNKYVRYISDYIFDENSLGKVISINQTDFMLYLPGVRNVTFNLNHSSAILNLLCNRSKKDKRPIFLENCNITGNGMMSLDIDDFKIIKNCNITCSYIRLNQSTTGNKIFFDYLKSITNQKYLSGGFSWAKFLSNPQSKNDIIDDQLSINDIMEKFGFVDCKFNIGIRVILLGTNYICYISPSNAQKPYQSIGSPIYTQSLKDNKLIRIYRY